ncbi:unnamed protein product, partial [Porites lobata]
INPEKTKFVVVGSAQLIKRLPHISLSQLGKTISPVSVAKDLGIVWGNTSKRNLHKLQLVQNFAARVVLGLKKFDHISQGRRSLKDVTEKVLFNDLLLVFKCVNGLAPDYLGKYFIKRSAVHNKNTRGCNDFVVPRCRLSMGQRAFYFRGPKEWNGLPDNIRNTKDIVSFKRRLFNRIFQTK